MPSGKIITPSMPAVVQNIGQQNLNTELKIDNAKEQVYRPEALVPNQRQQEPSHKKTMAKATSNSSGKAAPSTPKQGAKRPRDSNSPAGTQTPNKTAKPHHPLTGSATKEHQASPAHNRTPGSATKRRTMTLLREQEKRDNPSQKQTRTKNSNDGGNVKPGAKRRLNNKTAKGQPCELCTSTVGTTNHECGYNLCYYCTQRKLKTGLDGCLMCCEESSIPQAYKEGALALRRERALALRATKS